MPRLNENPLRKNCKAHFGQQCLDDFGRGGRRLTSVSQGRQGQKRRTEPPKCDTCSTPVGLTEVGKFANVLENGLPHQRARWFAMTGVFAAAKNSGSQSRSSFVYVLVCAGLAKHAEHVLLVGFNAGLVKGIDPGHVAGDGTG